MAHYQYQSLDHPTYIRLLVVPGSREAPDIICYLGIEEVDLNNLRSDIVPMAELRYKGLVSKEEDEESYTLIIIDRNEPLNVTPYLARILDELHDPYAAAKGRLHEPFTEEPDAMCLVIRGRVIDKVAGISEVIRMEDDSCPLERLKIRAELSKFTFLVPDKTLDSPPVETHSQNASSPCYWATITVRVFQMNRRHTHLKNSCLCTRASSTLTNTTLPVACFSRIVFTIQFQVSSTRDCSSVRIICLASARLGSYLVTIYA
jgi:hypothetical protein